MMITGQVWISTYATSPSGLRLPSGLLETQQVDVKLTLLDSMQISSYDGRPGF